MARKIDSHAFRHPRKEPLNLKRTPTRVAKFYRDKEDYQQRLTALREEIHEIQERLYAGDRHAVLVIFQAADAAGKDGTIEHVFSGINPQGVEVSSFKRPSQLELDHDFLWRHQVLLPERGKIAIHNRSHYEEVLVCRVHPEIITGAQRLPLGLTKDLKALFRRRYDSIRDFEKHLTRNGTHVVKFYLHLSKEEQRQRLLARLDDPAKHWKFEPGDLKERALWDEYQKAYEECLRETAATHAPWYVVPADDKRNLRLIVATALRDELRTLDADWPKVTAAERKVLEACRQQLLDEKK